MKSKKKKSDSDFKCSQCAFRLKSVCIKRIKNCRNFMQEETSCKECKLLKDCLIAGKHVSTKEICGSFALSKKPPEKIKHLREKLVKKGLLNPDGSAIESKKTKPKKRKPEPEVQVKMNNEGGIIEIVRNTPVTKEPLMPISVSSYLDKLDETEDKDLYSPVSLIDKIISSDYDSRAFELIDDSDIPRAKNEVEFVIDPKFLGETLYPRQLKTVMDFFGSNCPFCSDTDFLHNIEVDTEIGDILDAAVLYKNGKCPKCKKTKYDAVRKGKLHRYNQLIGIAGQRSGKSMLCSIISATITHKYLMLANPADFFKLSRVASHLQGTFVSLTFNQAYENLWLSYHKLITETPWFVTYNDFLKQQGERLGQEILKLREQFVVYGHKNMSFLPSGPDKRKLRGRTRILSSIDEICWFFGTENAVKYDPDEIYAALNNSMLTVSAASRRKFPVYPDAPTAYGIYISSPHSKLDIGMRMLKQSKIDPTIYGFHYPTWEFNPTIQRKDLNSDYLKDPVKAERDFGANPPMSDSPFVSSAAALISLFTKKENCFSTLSPRVIADSLNNNLLAPRVKVLKKHSHPACLCIDCGYNNNSFAMTLMNIHHPGEEDESIRVAGVIELVPDPYPLSYPDIYENIISKIIEHFNVRLVLFDRWQSIDLSQRVYRDFEIDAVRYSVKYDDFNELRARIYSEEMIFPRLDTEPDNLIALDFDIKDTCRSSPVDHMFLQLLLSKDTGKSIVKNTENDITDDILRCVVLGHYALNSAEYEELFEGEGEEEGQFSIADMISVIPKSGGVSASFNSSAVKDYAGVFKYGG